jgi:hypothetical protein
LSSRLPRLSNAFKSPKENYIGTGLSELGEELARVDDHVRVGGAQIRQESVLAVPVMIVKVRIRIWLRTRSKNINSQSHVPMPNEPIELMFSSDIRNGKRGMVTMRHD